jgi:hypothetical protein
VANLTDDLIAEMHIPELPAQIPQRLEEAIVAKANSLLYHLREAKRHRYIQPLEVRLIRDTFRIVLTAYELNIPGSKVFYGEFKTLIADLGYERTDVGFIKKAEVDE